MDLVKIREQLNEITSSLMNECSNLMKENTSLKKSEINKVRPLMDSSTLLLSFILGYIIFKEKKITKNNIIGGLIIIVGIVIFSK